MKKFIIKKKKQGATKMNEKELKNGYLYKYFDDTLAYKYIDYGYYVFENLTRKDLHITKDLTNIEPLNRVKEF